ncbi:MAG: protein BatD [Myxococcales bacterium]|nr:protein BatD [Myxococcales bacterium]
MAGLVALLTVLPAAANAQNVSFELRTDRTTGSVGEPFRARIELEVSGAEAGDVELPDLEDFQVVGRSVSSPVQFSISFGSRTQQVFKSSKVIDLTLIPLREGEIPLGPARTTVNGKTFETNTMVLRIGAGTAPTPEADNPAPSSKTGPSGQMLDSDFFIETVVDETEVYPGQQVSVSVWLHTRDQLVTAPAIHREVSTDGFWVENLRPGPQRVTSEIREIGGRRFHSYELRRFAAFPLAPGDLTLGAMDITAQVGSNSIFSMRSRSLRRQSAPVAIHVKEFPGKVPDGEIITGTAQIRAEVVPAEVRTGDAATVRAVVEGSGHLRVVQLTLPKQPNLRVFDPQVSDRTEIVGDVLGGQRTFEWLVVPDAPGTFSIPAFVIHVFDPITERFVTHRSEPQTLVAKGTATPESDPQPDSFDAPSGPMGQFPPIRPASELRGEQRPLSSHPAYPWVLALPPALLLVSMALRWARRKTHTRQTSKAALWRQRKRAMGAARSLAENGDAPEFYRTIAALVKTTLEGLLGEPIGGMTHAELESRLVERLGDEDLAQRTVEEFEGFDFARFAATAATREELLHCHGRVAALLERMDTKGEGP